MSADSTNIREEAQATLQEIPGKVKRVGKNMNKLASTLREPERVQTGGSGVVPDQDHRDDLSALFGGMGELFVTLGDQLKGSCKAGTKAPAIYSSSFEAFKRFFENGYAKIHELERKPEARLSPEEVRQLEDAYDALEGIQKQNKEQLDKIYNLRITLKKQTSVCKKTDAEKFPFYNGLYMNVDQLHDVYSKFDEALSAAVPEYLDTECINIAEIASKLEDAVRGFTESLKDIYIPFVEDYAITAETIKIYTDVDTFNIYDEDFKAPVSGLRALFDLLNKLYENTSGDAHKAADTALSKVRDCTNRIKCAFEYCRKVEWLLEFRKKEKEYNIDDKVVADGTRELVLQSRSGSFVVNGDFYLSNFEKNKAIAAKFFTFNNGVLLCSTKTKETRLVDFKDVDVTSGKDTLCIVHESKKWNVTISGLGKYFDEFRDTVLRLAKASRETRVFGSDLGALAARSRSSRPYIPGVIDVAMQYLLLPKSIATEGIMRRSGNEKVLDRLVHATDNEYQVHFNDPLTAAAFLKRWIQNIPGALMVNSKIDEWKSAESDPDRLVSVFKSLPEPNQAVFKALIELSVRIMKEESSNKMNKDALITCLQMIVLDDRYVSGSVLSAFLDNPGLMEESKATMTPPIRVMPEGKEYVRLSPRMISKHQKNASLPVKMNFINSPKINPNNGNSTTTANSNNGNGASSSTSSSSGSSSRSSSSSSSAVDTANGKSITIVRNNNGNAVSGFKPPSPPFSFTKQQPSQPSQPPQPPQPPPPTCQQFQGIAFTSPQRVKSSVNLKLQPMFSPVFSTPPLTRASNDPPVVNFPPLDPNSSSPPLPLPPPSFMKRATFSTLSITSSLLSLS